VNFEVELRKRLCILSPVIYFPFSLEKALFNISFCAVTFLLILFKVSKVMFFQFTYFQIHVEYKQTKAESKFKILSYSLSEHPHVRRY
jgi:hypothetical protein